MEESGLASLAEYIAYDFDGDGFISLEDLLDLAITPNSEERTLVYVDFGFEGGRMAGTKLSPYNTLATGITEIDPGGYIFVSPGQSSETPTITKQMKLRRTAGTSGTIQIGVPE